MGPGRIDAERCGGCVMTVASRKSRKPARSSGRRTTQPLTRGEIAAVRTMARREVSRRKIAIALGIARSSVARVLDDLPKAVKPKKPGDGRSIAARRQRDDQIRTTSELRPRHVSARPFSRRWFEQCNRAFCAAMAVAHNDRHNTGER